LEKQLEPYAAEYSALINRIEADLRDMTDDQLLEVGFACTKPTETNCWWAIHRVAPIVAGLIKGESWRRSKAREGAPG
jgi:hypothetical protein